MRTLANPDAATGFQRQTARILPAFTGLRAVAAYLVFLHHYNPAPIGTLANRLFHQGYIGVSIFFVLSGFLIGYRYASAFMKQTNGLWRRYLQNRFARTFPLYALFLLLTVGADTWRGHPMRLPVLVLNITLLKGFSETYLFSGIAQSWSLTVELCFYLAAPLLFIGLKRWNPLILTAMLLGLGVLIWTAINPFFGDAEKGTAGWLPFLLFYTFFGRSFEFVAGMWLANQYRQNRLPAVPYATKTGLLVIIGCVLWQSSVVLFTTSRALLNASEAVVYNLVLPVGICLFLIGLLAPTSRTNRLLSHSFVQALGRSSYAFYLLHIGVVARSMQKAGVTNDWLLFGLLVLIAYGAYTLVEKPLHQWLRFRDRNENRRYTPDL